MAEFSSRFWTKVVWTHLTFDLETCISFTSIKQSCCQICVSFHPFNASLHVDSQVCKCFVVLHFFFSELGFSFKKWWHVYGDPFRSKVIWNIKSFVCHMTSSTVSKHSMVSSLSHMLPVYSSLKNTRFSVEERRKGGFHSCYALKGQI